MKAVGLITEFGPVLVFPFNASTLNANEMQSWSLNDGHGTASEDWVLNQTRLSRKEEIYLITEYRKTYDIKKETITVMKFYEWDAAKAQRKMDVAQWARMF
jgi:hypothetical protein